MARIPVSYEVFSQSKKSNALPSSPEYWFRLDTKYDAWSLIEDALLAKW